MVKRILTADQKKRQLACVRQHYANNKAYYAERNRRKTAEVKAWFVEYMHGKCCCCCAESERCTLDFHHLDPITKRFNVSYMISSAHAISSILKEMSKCVIICSNCHRKLHAGLLQI